jgi:hypothetical protein
MLWKICRWKFWSICLAAAVARPSFPVEEQDQLVLVTDGGQLIR